MNGDKRVIDALNKVLKNELTAINQYFLHARMFRNWGLEKLNDYQYKQSIRVMKEADELIERILFLEGTPDLTKREALKVGKTVPEMLKADLAVEYKVVGELKKAMAACELAQDYVTRDMLGVQLEDTEMDHAYYLEKQLGLIELVGLENYQQSQMGSGTPA